MLAGKPPSSHVRFQVTSKLRSSHTSLILLKYPQLKMTLGVSFSLTLKNPFVRLVNRAEVKENVIQQAVGVCHWHRVRASPHLAKQWRGWARTGDWHLKKNTVDFVAFTRDTYLVTVLETTSPRSRCQQGGFPLRPLSLAGRWLPSCHILTWTFVCVHVSLVSLCESSFFFF